MRAAATVAIAVLLAARPAGERLPLRTFTTADGLPRDQLDCVHVDRRGFVWFCTGDGVVRFDGEQAAVFGRDDGLNPSEVRSFLITTEGQYWAGATAGLFEFRAHSGAWQPRFRAVLRDDGRPTGTIRAFAESHDGSVWCASGRGLLHLTRSQGTVNLREVEIGLPRTSEDVQIVRAVLEDERRTLWVGAASGLYMRKPDGHTVHVTMTDGLQVDEVRALALDRSGRLWAATRQGLAWIERDDSGIPDRPLVRRTFTSTDGLPASNVNSLLAEADTLWVGTVNGVAETRLTGAGTMSVGRTLTGFYAWSLAIDRHQDLWVATESGARKLSRHGFTTYTGEDGLTNTRVSSVFTTANGEVCSTTLVRGFGLSCFDGSRFRTVSIAATHSIANPGWGSSQLTLQDRMGRWWVPTGEGLLQFDPGPVSVLQHSRAARRYDARAGLLSSDIFRIFEDSTGGVWVSAFAETGNGLARIDPSGVLRTFSASDGLPTDLPLGYAFAEDRSGNIWVACEFGMLLRYRAGRFEQIPIHDAPPTGVAPRVVNEQLRSLLIDRQGRLWIASSLSGLGRIEDPTDAAPRVVWFATKQGLASDAAWMLVEHDSGDLFVGTPRGVDRFNPETGRVAHYTPDDGFPRGEIWGATRDRTSQLWFATTSGLARLSAIEDRSLPPPVTVVTAVRVGGAALAVAADGATRLDPFDVQPGDRSLDIEFVSPGALHSDGLRYEYQLEGVSREWTTADARVVTLAGTAAGRYRFRVRSVLANGVAGEPAHVDFNVLAPVWQRPWFIALAAFSAVLIGLAWHRARVTRLLEIERVRSRIAADLHDDVASSLSRVAILTDVAKRQATASGDELTSTLDVIGETARGLVDGVSDVVWAVDPGRDDLGSVVARLREFAGDVFDARGVSWTLVAPTDVDRVRLVPEQRRHLYLIVKEAVNNAARHSSCRHVTIAFRVAQPRLEAEVQDDGVGFDREREGGHGLANMRRRAEAIGGVLTIESMGAAGTKVSLSTPLGA